MSILDDGLETTHSDIIENYDPLASYDAIDKDKDPTPRYSNPEKNHHGTRCAGEVAMSANNGICGVGLAYNVRIGGIRMLDGKVTDRVEAKSLSYNRDYIDIYSSSWGPEDDGKTVEGPGRKARRALFEGAAKGRGGLGSIFIWATGNGGLHGDTCATDGYVSSIYTLSVGSTTQSGKFPAYGEACASLMSVTYSSGMPGEGKIVSTDLNNQCTVEHTGMVIHCQ